MMYSSFTKYYNFYTTLCNYWWNFINRTKFYFTN